MRLTRNINGKFILPRKNIENGNINPLLDKLGKLEDILDEYGIENIDLLSKKLKCLEILKEFIKLNKSYCPYMSMEQHRGLEQDEYELLKEVLL